jgi:hypothetical protein
MARAYRRFVWRRNSFAHNHWLDDFIRRARGSDYVVANGDYSCDTAFVGVSDLPSRQSAALCLEKLRSAFGANVFFTIGDHELGKMSLFGGRGGLRLASWECLPDLELEPFWQLEVGNFLLLGVTSSLIALPIYEPEILSEERSVWYELRQVHLARLCAAFASLKPAQRVFLFCHDPTALPFLWREEKIRSKLDQVALTVIGHLHSSLFLWPRYVLAGMPSISFLGNTIRRSTKAIQEATYWKAFRPRLCPSLGGVELIKDGGFCQIDIHREPSHDPRFQFSRLRLTDHVHTGSALRPFKNG